MDDLFPASVACLIVSTSISLVGTLYFVFCAKTEEGRLINTRELSDGIAKYTWLLLISASNPETLALMPWRDPLTAKRSFGGLPNPQAAVFCTVAATLETVPQTVINILYQQRSEEVAWNVQMQVGLSVLTFTVHVLGRYLMACLNQTRTGTAVEQADGSGVSHQKHTKEHSKAHRKKDSGSRQELIKEMEARGLTEEDQEKLIQEEGFDTVELFRELDDDDFEQCGIDINARKQTKAAQNAVRRAKEAAEKADHEAQLSRNISMEKRDEARRERDHEMQRDKDDLVKLLETEGGSLTAEGRGLIQQEIPNLRRLFSLDKDSMNTMNLKLKDKKALQKLLESSLDPTLQTGRKNLPKLERALASTPFGALVFFFAAPSVLPAVYLGTFLCAHRTRRLTRSLLAL
jgi:hypothetical protein